MKKLCIVFLLLCSLSVFGESRFGETAWRPYLEFDQMMVLKGGAEYSLSPSWGVKGGIGFSVGGFTVVGYEILSVYHLKKVDSRFQWDIEFGLPLAYFDVFEGNLVDWDPAIDDPYAGWAPGASLVWGRKLKGGGVLCLKTGVLCVFEYQRDSGWRDDLLILPEISIQWIFRLR